MDDELESLKYVLETEVFPHYEETPILLYVKREEYGDIINDITNGFKDVEYPDSLFRVAEFDLFGRGKEPSFVRILQFKKCIEIYLDMVDILKDISAKDFNGLERYKGKEFGEMLRVKKIQYYLDKRG
jgi:hypothetical protein